MYEQGMSLADVAAFYGVTRQAMWAWFRCRKVPLRSNLRHGQENHFHRNGKRSSKPAVHLVEKAVKKGVVVRPSVCEACGKNCVPANNRPQIEAHHDDYNKPLDVRWLCRECHFQWHRNNRAVPKK